jgi:hypothetical protein
MRIKFVPLIVIFCIILRIAFGFLITGKHEDIGLYVLRLQYTVNAFDYLLWIGILLCDSGRTNQYIRIFKLAGIGFFTSMAIFSMYVWLPAEVRHYATSVGMMLYIFWSAVAICLSALYIFCLKGKLFA